VDRSGTRAVRSFEPQNTVQQNLETWADAIEGRAAYRFTPAQLLANVQVLEAVVRSASDGGGAVAIPLA
jgi:predicted dehydrogenase